MPEHPTADPPARREHRWPTGLTGIAHGGDHNAEQWPEEIWLEDVALMREAGVDLVSVGIFAWAALQPSRTTLDPGWMDRLLDLLHAHGIRVDLATPTAAPPAWLYREHPEAWVVDADGRRLGPGSRGAMCPSSPAYRAAAAAITRVVAERWAHHPAVAMWHVHNEYGAPDVSCHCPTSAAAFRRWLLARHGDLAGINAAWGTSFWGQRYGDVEEIRTPAVSASVVNPAQQLDWARFCDAELRACFTAERDVIHAVDPAAAVTTNFMATSCPATDLWAWSREVDVVANDHYLTAARTDAHVMLAMDADLTRSLAGGRPWLLLEHSTSAVNWQPRNVAKRPGELARGSLAHLARGADGVLFFQWRAARTGAERFHSAMLPHSGTGSRVWREVVELGGFLGRLGEVRGERVTADVALLWDWESLWAQDQPWHPSTDLDPRERTEAFYSSLWEDHVTTDFAHPEADLSGYRVVVAPQLHLLTRGGAANLHRFVEGGGTLLVSYYSGVVDETTALHPGSFNGALAGLLGVEVEEFAPLREGERCTVAPADGPGTTGGLTAAVSADVWSEHLRLHPGVEVLARFADGPAAGGAALTRRAVGRGAAWYLATRPDAAGLRAVLDLVLADAGLAADRSLPAALEVVRRLREDGSGHVVLINHGDVAVEVALPRAAPGRPELLTATLLAPSPTPSSAAPSSAGGGRLLSGAGGLTVPAGAVRVVAETPFAEWSHDAATPGA